jgi:hypothetical protein
MEIMLPIGLCQVILLSFWAPEGVCGSVAANSEVDVTASGPGAVLTLSTIPSFFRCAPKLYLRGTGLLTGNL